MWIIILENIYKKTDREMKIKKEKKKFIHLFTSAKRFINANDAVYFENLIGYIAIFIIFIIHSALQRLS